MWWLFDTDGFVPRSNCGAWTEVLKWAWWVGNGSIALAYVIMPIQFVWFWRKRKSDKINRPWIYVCYAAFVGLCGLGHLLTEIAVFWWPAYRFFTAWHVATGVVSLLTCAANAYVLPKLRTSQEVHDERDRANAAVLSQELTIQTLQRRVIRLQRAVSSGAYLSELGTELEAAQQELDALSQRGA